MGRDGWVEALHVRSVMRGSGVSLLGIIVGLVLWWVGDTFLETPPQTPQEKRTERDYQNAFCPSLKGQMEYVLPDKTRVDCLTATHAIEIDWAEKWAEGIGQALYYAKITGKAPAVALIVGEKDARYLKRLELVAEDTGITVFVIAR